LHHIGGGFAHALDRDRARDALKRVARWFLTFSAFERKDQRRFEMNCAFPIDSLSGSISVTNPFDGVEVGTVVNIPPEGAQGHCQVDGEAAVE